MTSPTPVRTVRIEHQGRVIAELDQSTPDGRAAWDTFVRDPMGAAQRLLAVLDSASPADAVARLAAVIEEQACQGECCHPYVWIVATSPGIIGGIYTDAWAAQAAADRYNAISTHALATVLTGVPLDDDLWAKVWAGSGERPAFVAPETCACEKCAALAAATQPASRG